MTAPVALNGSSFTVWERQPDGRLLMTRTIWNLDHPAAIIHHGPACLVMTCGHPSNDRTEESIFPLHGAVVLGQENRPVRPRQQ